MPASRLTIIGTCPTLHTGESATEYLQRLKAATAQAESQGWSSMLIYSDHKQVDPWIVAQHLLGMTTRLTPLIALQPLYMHPFTAAKAVASLSLLYDRAVNLNFVSGGLPRDLETLCDTCTHDERYERIIEYGAVLKHILLEKAPLTFEGRFYRVRSLQLQPWPSLKPHCVPMLTISGSSPAGLAAAQQLGARAIQYLRPQGDYVWATFSPHLQYGTRLGIIARATTGAAWQAARERYPEDPAGAQVRKYFTKATDSVWVKDLGRIVETHAENPYWLGPYRNNQASCPFLVGDVQAVSVELAGYIRMGLRTFLVESPADDADACCITEAFEAAQALADSATELAS